VNVQIAIIELQARLFIYLIHIYYYLCYRELQNQIEQFTKQFKIIYDVRRSPQRSLIINREHACSSPISNFFDRSNKSWHDLSELSSIDFVQHVLKENVL